jgi:hypothetical protein
VLWASLSIRGHAGSAALHAHCFKSFLCMSVFYLLGFFIKKIISVVLALHVESIQSPTVRIGCWPSILSNEAERLYLPLSAAPANLE